MNGLLNTVARNTSAGVLAQVLIKVFSFAFTVLIIRRLGVETYGQYAAVMAFGAVFVFLADLGLGTWAVRETAHVRDAAEGRSRVEQLLGNIVPLRVLLALLAVSAILLTGWLTGRPPAMMLGLLLGGLGLLLYGAEGAFEAILSGYERLDIIAGGRVLQQIAFVLLGAIALFAGLPYHALIVANLVGILILTLVVWRGLRDEGLRRAPATPARWSGMLRAALPFGAVSLALGLSYRFDTVLLNITHGDETTGTYSAAYTLVFSLVVLSNVLNTSLFPSLTRQASLAPQTLPRIYGRVLRVLLAVALPLAVGGWALAGDLIPLLYGEQYAGSVWVLQVVIWAVPLMFVTEFLGYVVLIGRREQSVARAVILSSSANVLGNLLLIPFFGIVAAAVMTVVTELVLLLQYIWLVRHELRAMHALQMVLRPLGAVTIMAVVTLLLRGWAPLWATIVLSALAYAGALLLTGAVTRADLATLRGIRLRRAQPQPKPAPVLAVEPVAVGAGAAAPFAAALPAEERTGSSFRPLTHLDRDDSK